MSNMKLFQFWSLLLLLGSELSYVSSFSLLKVTESRGARHRGFQSSTDSWTTEISSILAREDSEYSLVQELTKMAVHDRGTERGMAALEQLGALCSRRLSFDFDSVRNVDDADSVLCKIPTLLPTEVTAEIFRLVKGLEAQGLLSTNPDSVDGLPSFHLNLISEGEPIVSIDNVLESEHLEEFQECIRELTKLVSPYIYEQLLPRVNQLLNVTNIKVGDVFLRRYGQDLIDGKSRQGISAHYDVFSKVTSVIALDDIAATGRNGLYTTAICARNGKSVATNHASQRRFFPLACGDAVVHTWDVLHGVDVEPGLDRTSLIVWFTADEKEKETGKISPWLFGRSDMDENDVAQFVLASALESSLAPDGNVESQQSMHLLSPKETGVTSLKPIDLYLESAALGNTFAFTRLGSLCEENALSPCQYRRAKAILESFRVPTQELLQNTVPIQQPEYMELAKRFWYEGSIRGSPLAQMALADELMVQAVSGSNDHSSSSTRSASDLRLTAAVLFGLAAQQGYAPAMDSLQRVMQLEATTGEYDSQQDFSSSALVQTITAACNHMI